jgi:chromosome segregation ATPase
LQLRFEKQQRTIVFTVSTSGTKSIPLLAMNSDIPYLARAFASHELRLDRWNLEDLNAEIAALLREAKVELDAIEAFNQESQKLVTTLDGIRREATEQQLAATQLQSEVIDLRATANALLARLKANLDQEQAAIVMNATQISLLSGSVTAISNRISQLFSNNAVLQLELDEIKKMLKHLPSP